MLTVIKTKTGSIYHIDQTNMEWAKMELCESSKLIKTVGGKLLSLPNIELGNRLEIISHIPDQKPRLIMTSEVVEILNSSDSKI